MKLNININKEDLKAYGKTAGRITKAIAIEGTKALVLKTAAAAITTSFEDGLGGIKNLKLDDVIGEEKSKEKKPRKKLFGKKNKEDVVEEILEGEIVEKETVEDKLERAKKILDKNS